jgi:hypothetical protein
VAEQRFRSTSSDLDTEFIQQAIVGVQADGTSNNAVVFSITAEVDVIHVDELVYVIPNEITEYKIVSESREYKIVKETRLHKVVVE